MFVHKLEDILLGLDKWSEFCTSSSLSTYCLTVHAVGDLEQTLELILFLVDKQGDDLSNESVLVVVDALVASAERTKQRSCVYGRIFSRDTDWVEERVVPS